MTFKVYHYIVTSQWTQQQSALMLMLNANCNSVSPSQKLKEWGQIVLFDTSGVKSTVSIL
jgi:hypothetical protein